MLRSRRLCGMPPSSRSNSVIEPPSSAWRVSSTSSTPSIVGRGSYGCSSNRRSALALHSMGSFIQQTPQILPVGVALHRLGEPEGVRGARLVHPLGDLPDPSGPHPP